MAVDPTYKAIVSYRLDVQWRPELVALTAPMVTVSENNMRDHWAVKARRVKEQRTYINGLLADQIGPITKPVGAVVHLRRIGPRILDDDNLRGSLKAVRDGVSDWLGVDDGKKCLEWHYSQATGKHAVEVAAAVEWPN